MSDIEKVLKILSKLQNAHIYYNLRSHRSDAISVDVAVPGQRWEIDFVSDGTIDIEIFKSDGTIHDENILADLFQNFSD